MGIQINGATDSITAIDGTIDVVSAIGNAGVVTATAFVGNITGNVTGNINHASNLELQTGGVTRASIDSSGRVLIGTTTEGGTGADNLTIATSGATGITVRSGTSSNGNLFFSDGTSGADEYRGVVQYNHTDNFLRFYTNGAEKLRIDSGGSVRIANTNFSAAGNADELILGDTSGNRGLTIVSGNTGIGALFFADDGSTNIGSLVYEHNTNQMRMNVNGGQVMRLDYTSVPTWIYGSDTNTYTSLPAADTIAFTTGGTERLRIDSSGNVTINTGNLIIPDSIIHSGDTDTKIVFTNNQIDLQCASASRAYINNYGFYIASGFALAFLSSSGPTPHIKSGGTNSQDLLFTTGSGNPTRLQITSGGNVEIGSGAGTGSDYSLLDGMVINTANGSAGLIINSSSSSHNAYMSFGYGSGSGTSHHDQYSAYIGRVGDNNLIFGTNNSIRASIDSSGVFNLNNIVQVGTTNDTGELRIGHDGSNYRARIVSNSSNSLEIDADGPERIQMHGGVIYMRPINSEKSAAFVANGSAELYYDDVKKFQTSSAGSQVFGTFQSIPQNNSQKGAYFGPYVIDNSQSAQTDDTVDIRSLKGVALDLTRYYTSGDIQTFRINNDYEGAIYVSPTGVNYNSTSDYRLKENVINLTGAIDRVKQLKPKRFNFIKDPGNTIDGFMAHEVSSVVPNAVIGEKDATMTTYYDEGDTIPDGKVIGDVKENAAIDPQSMDDSRLVPLLTAALQEAITKIETLESKVAALEGS